MAKTENTDVLIIGGGATGTGLARDLALRGLGCILAEQADINAGASGANHGLLHSGARYVAKDSEVARECAEEGALVKKLAPACVEDCGGIFAAVPGDDENYIADFQNMCDRAKVPCRTLDVKQAREMEPSLSPDIIAAFAVEDASLDPFMLSLENIADARKHGTRLYRHTKVAGFTKKGGRIESALLKDLKTGEETIVYAREVVNAAGAWSGLVCKMAGVDIGIVYSKGSLLVTYSRVADRVINRLRLSSDGDILVPGGTVSLLGTTSLTVDSPDGIRPTVAETDLIVDESAKLVPSLAGMRYIRAYAGVRPLISTGRAESGRAISRGIALLDHAADGVENFSTISGGKLSTYRLMAEQAADLVCERLGVTEPCKTAVIPLPSTQAGQWTEPGMAPRLWMKESQASDYFLCECEMVSKSAVDRIVRDLCESGQRPDIQAISLRSRVGKGGCQGAFCGSRIAAYLSDQGHFVADMGGRQLRDFFSRRWKGVRPVSWGPALVQEQFTDALYCSLFELEITDPLYPEAGKK